MTEGRLRLDIGGNLLDAALGYLVVFIGLFLLMCVVIAVGKVKERDFDYVLREIRALRAASQGKVLKVIIETCLLTEEEKIAARRPHDPALDLLTDIKGHFSNGGFKGDLINRGGRISFGVLRN